MIPHTVIGSGPMGMILTSLLASKGGTVNLVCHDGEESLRLDRDRQATILNQKVPLADNVQIHSRIPELPENGILTVAVSSRELEDSIERMVRGFAGQTGTIVLFTKGLPSHAARRKYGVFTFCDYMERVATALGKPGLRFAAVNGPSLLAEVFYGLPTFLNVGCADPDAGQRVAEYFATDRVFCAHTTDVVGVEAGGVLKNPLAIAVGIASALSGSGDNFAGELIQRGFDEMLRLALQLGARQETLLGRSGLADLITTCVSRHSRNRAYGEDFVQRLQAGEEQGFFDQIQTLFSPASVIQRDVARRKDVVEGGYAIANVLEIAGEFNIDMPVYHTIYEILSRRKQPAALIETVTGAPLPESDPLVLRKRKGLNLASGSNFVEVLTERVLFQIRGSRGLKERIERQTAHILQQLEKRIQKLGSEGGKVTLAGLVKERELWSSMRDTTGDHEGAAMARIIQFYAEEIADNYTPGMREALIRVLGPVRFAVSGFRSGSSMPEVGGRVEELKRLATHYNVLYAPTHRSHLDSVEVACALSWLSLPLPRYAAGSNLMTEAFQSWLLRSFGAYAVDRERTRNFLYLECLSAYACLLLESGIPSLVYPEGTRSRTGGIVTIKTGLLSTAIQAFQNTGREVIVAPLALSYENLPEDRYYCEMEPEPPFKDFIQKRGRVYLDIGEPIRVSRHVSAEDPTAAIALAIQEEWRKHLRVLPNQLLARILAENGHAVAVDSLTGLVDEFLQKRECNFAVRDPEEIKEKGLASLAKYSVARIEDGRLISLNQALTAFYGNMVPCESGTLLDQAS